MIHVGRILILGHFGLGKVVSEAAEIFILFLLEAIFSNFLALDGFSDLFEHLHVLDLVFKKGSVTLLILGHFEIIYLTLPLAFLHLLQALSLIEILRVHLLFLPSAINP